MFMLLLLVFVLCTQQLHVHVGGEQYDSIYSSDFVDKDFYKNEYTKNDNNDTNTSNNNDDNNNYWEKEAQHLGEYVHQEPTPIPNDEVLQDNLQICPPESISSRRTRCICRLGYGCAGSKRYCQIGLSNRAVRHRIEGWLRQKCKQCRCDPLACKKYRKTCDAGCQSILTRVLPSPDKSNRVWHQGLPTVMCIILVHRRVDKVEKMLATWGTHCDYKLLVVMDIYFPGSNQSVYNNADRIVVVDSKHGHPLRSITPLANILLDVVNNEGNLYSYFLVVSDDTFMIMHNLKKYLASLQQQKQQEQKPLYVGRRLLYKEGLVYNHMESGWVINYAALVVLVNKFNASEQQRHKPLKYNRISCILRDRKLAAQTRWEGGCLQWAYENTTSTIEEFRCDALMSSGYLSPAVIVAGCFSDAGVVAKDTRDAKGLERFSLFNPVEIAYSSRVRLRFVKSDLSNSLFPAFRGRNGISQHTISFANIDRAEQYEAYEAFLGRECYPTTIPKYYEDDWARKRRAWAKYKKKHKMQSTSPQTNTTLS
eukprot:m.13261 g.13261  ORF g.13261 m.13261 type:complete len:537 (+) comp4822_c0_seq1:286-1896(+)